MHGAGDKYEAPVGEAVPARAWILVALLLLAGCTTPAPPPDANDPGGEDGNDTAPNDRGSMRNWSFVDAIPPADPARLLELVEDQVYRNASTQEPRYRTPGSPGHAEAIPLLEEALEARGLTVQRESFTAELPRLGETNLTNLYGVREGLGEEREREIWLAAHWDSRAWADASTGDDCEGVGEPVLGANDGAAGVAVVLHAIDLLGPTNHTIRVALFDGEDQGCHGQGWAMGSKHAAETRSEAELDRITGFLLVDMPGDANLTIRREGWSEVRAPAITDLAFTAAEKLGATNFLNESGPSITDDHLAFLERDVPAVDLIHLDCDRSYTCEDPRRGPFPWTHHTVHDTPEHLSVENMAEVTEVVVATVVAIDRGWLSAQT